MVQKSETSSAQNTSKEEKYSSLLSSLKHFTFRAILMAIIAGGAWYVYAHPQILQRFQTSEPQENVVTHLENQISILQNELRGLQAENANKISRTELDALHEKMENVANINNEILASKASNAAILGLLSRVDDLEMKTKALGKVSSQGALILTAAMLVKEEAGTGKPFEYEAEVLKQLAMGTNMESSADKIAQFAPQGISSQQNLIDDFNQLYAQKHLPQKVVIEDQPAENDATTTSGWKEKINSKLSELITIEYHDEAQDAHQQTNTQDEVYQLVNQGRLLEASSKMAQLTAYDTTEFNHWRLQAQARDEFMRALSRIQALTLAFMKAENLKNTYGNDINLPQ